MPILADAWESLKRNQSALFLYVGGRCLLTLIINTATILLGITPDSDSSWIHAFEFSTDLLDAAAYSALMAIVFARMGEDIDRPLWRCPSDREALRRFFVPWFIINIALLTMIQLSGRAAKAENSDLAGSLGLLILLATLVAVPIGACIMYHGRLRWSELDEALKPLIAHLDLMLPVFGVLLLQFLLLMLAAALHVPWDELPDKSLWSLVKTQALFWAIASVPLNALDCLAFAMVWRICMIHRDEGVDDSDPFDF
ncbi:MAG: hypothetical protein HYV26_09525 [Candidatus Hydrogenedentes bacterium]|nr:hypothetical protein [Candidatus Hydrogenedentota bacterium]